MKKNKMEEFDQAIAMGDIETIKRLLDCNTINPADDNNLAICCASTRGHVDVVKLLLADPRVNPDDDENSAIYGAIEYGHIEIVRILLADSRVDPTSNCNMAIQDASTCGHVEVVKLLLEDKRVNPKGENGIRIINPDSYVKFEDIVVFDDVLCDVENEDIDSIEDPVIREKYIKWLYRIGGEKWSQARNVVENLK